MHARSAIERSTAWIEADTWSQVTSGFKAWLKLDDDQGPPFHSRPKRSSRVNKPRATAIAVAAGKLAQLSL